MGCPALLGLTLAALLAAEEPPAELEPAPTTPVLVPLPETEEPPPEEPPAPPAPPAPGGPPAADPAPAPGALPAAPAPVADALRVFVDCGACDQNFLRSEITFVDHVREPQDADVHVLVASQGTGPGGTEYRVEFIGRRRFEGVTQALRYAAVRTATPDARRRGLVRVLKLGLVRYVVETPLGAQLDVTFEPPTDAALLAEAKDPWNSWVFRTGFSGQLTGEQATALTTLKGSVGANRTTEAWKLDLGLDVDYSRERFELEAGETFTSSTYSVAGRGLVTRSLTDHWSMGFTANASTSTFLNYRLRTRLAPGVEFSVFPYPDSTRRSLTLLYTLGLQTFAYREETIFGRRSERQPDHRLDATLAFQQPWGTASGSVGVAQFLAALQRYRLTALVTLDVRLFRGLSMDVSGRLARRQDQINLPRGSATDEEILVRQRELATGYQYDLILGFSYTFGSIFNNVVNPRYRGADAP